MQAYTIHCAEGRINKVTTKKTLELTEQQIEILTKAVEIYRYSVDMFIGEGMYARGRIQPDYDISVELLDMLNRL